MSPLFQGVARTRLLAGVFVLVAIVAPLRSGAIVYRQGWTPASFGMVAECGTVNPPFGYIFPGASCLYTTRIKFDPLVRGLAFAGTLGHGLWASAGGESWTPLAPQCITGSSTVGNVSASYAEGKDGLTACGVEDF